MEYALPPGLLGSLQLAVLGNSANCEDHLIDKTENWLPENFSSSFQSTKIPDYVAECLLPFAGKSGRADAYLISGPNGFFGDLTCSEVAINSICWLNVYDLKHQYKISIAPIPNTDLPAFLEEANAVVDSFVAAGWNDRQNIFTRPSFVADGLYLPN